MELTAEVNRYKLNICKGCQGWVRGADSETYTGDRGRRRTKDASDILEELF